MEETREKVLFPNAKNKNEPLERVVGRRNKRILRLFSKNGFNVRLIGDPEKPAIILDNEIILSGYAHNFNFHFTNKPFEGQIVKTVKLHKDPLITKDEIEELLTAYEHRHAYKVIIKDSDLYLVGYNYLNREKGEGRYPVFARYNPKIYFQEDKAWEIANMLNEETYNLEVI
ncbi:hypothetical protein ACFLSA_04855 [Bacteroidota bacterium]